LTETRFNREWIEKELSACWAVSSYERDETIDSVFRAVVSGAPSAVALVSRSAQLTYEELDRRANGVANALLREGVSSGDTIGILCSRGVAFPIAMLGVLRAGAVFVPLEPDAPRSRQDLLISRAGCSLVLTSGVDTPLDVRTRCVDDINPEPAPAAPWPSRRADDAASVMFTSGSTGEPKGVVIPNRAIVRLCRNNWFCELGRSTRFLHIASPAFDASTLEIWGPLLNGGSVAIADPGINGVRELASFNRSLNANACFLTASLFNALVDKSPAVFEALELVIVGGDVVSAQHVHRLQQRYPALRIMNGYGPTENTTFTCCHPIADQSESGSIPIGMPIANSGVCVINEEGGLCPLGEIGELVALGDGLAIGYDGLPDETAQRFGDVEELGVRGYRTGDRVLMRRDGVIEFHGRNDDQVKIRGHRVEPAEVEAHIRKIDGVLDTVVVVTNRIESATLRAFVTLEQSHAWPRFRRTIVARLKERIPEYLVPTSIAKLDLIPLGSTGKADRKALVERVERGSIVDADWVDRFESRPDSIRAIVRLGVRLARLWTPHTPSRITVRWGDRSVDIPVDSDEPTETMIDEICAGLPFSADTLRVELYSPEGNPASLIVDDGLRLVLPAETSESLIKWRAHHARVVLDAVASNGGLAATPASVLHPDERTALECWERPRDWETPSGTLVSLFEEQAWLTPEAEAIRSDRLSIDYSQLIRRSNHVAEQLRRAGVCAGDRVAVFDTRSIDTIAGVYGVLRHGATCVPLDPGAPEHLNRQLIEDARVELVLTQCEGTTVSDVPHLLITSRESDESPSASPAPSDTAFILFTSGSTGRRKGVPIRHESILNSVTWAQREFELTPEDLFAQKTRLGWDVSIWEYMWPLAFGSRCFVMSGHVVADPTALVECVRNQSISVLHLVPSLMQPFAKAVRALGDPGLRLIIASGEPLHTATATDLVRSVDAELHNQYGPTEGAVVVTSQHILPDDPVTIGRAFSNVFIRIVDRDQHPCPVGVPGEIVLGGVQISELYLDAPGVSSSPFGRETVFGREWPTYLTGDVARWREDGEIEFLHRKDKQVQFLGLRIEIEEIEAALAGISGVVEVAVTKVGDGLEAELVGVCALDGIDIADVRLIARQRLEAMLIPSRFVQVNHLPRLVSGKVDRRRVLELGSPTEQGGEMTDISGLVDSVWAQLLGDPPESPDQSFNEAGGNSLALLRLLLEVESRLGVDLPAAPMLAEPTPRAIASVVSAIIHREKQDTDLLAHRRDPSSGRLVRLTYGAHPIVALPHLGGTLGFLSAVSAHLAGEFGVHGISPQGLFDGEQPFDSIDELVNDCADLIQRRGWNAVPLLGFSSGAVMSLGLARELISRGIDVPLLVLIDSGPHFGVRSQLATRLRHLRRSLASRAFRAEMRFGAKRETLGLAVSETQRRLIRSHYRGLAVYRAKPYPGSALVITTRVSRREHGLARWARVLHGPSDELVVDAGHMQMWEEPHATTFARELRSWLEKAVH
jgi:amino acid adenylation domain-containing protein